MGFFTKKKDSQYKEVAMSGQTLEIPYKSNLPTVVNWTSQQGLIRLGYGSDMQLPLLIEQSIFMAPSHKSCIKLKVSSAVGAGFEWLLNSDTDLQNKIQRTNFENIVLQGGIKWFIPAITNDFVLHNRICLKVTKSSSFIQYERVNPSMVGYNLDRTKFYISKNFEQGGTSQTLEIYNGQKEGVFMVEYDGNADKYHPYAVPEWLSIMPNIKINSQIPEFHEANMENSVGISLVFRKPTPFENEEQRNEYRQAITRERGVKGTGNFIVLSGMGMENVTEVQQLQPNQNDKLFEQLRNSTIDDICMGHNVNPVLIGVKTPGSLGANQEFDVAYSLFYAVEVVPIVEHIEFVLNDLLKSIGHTSRIKLNENKALRGLGSANINPTQI